MKKKKILMLLLSAALFLTACGGGNETGGSNTKQIGDEPHNGSSNQEDLQSDLSGEEKGSDSNSNETSFDNSQDGENQSSDFEVSVTFEEKEITKDSEDGDNLYSLYYSIPTLTINKYKDSEEKINTFFKKEAASFEEDSDKLEKMAEEEYSQMTDEEKEYFIGYYSYYYFETQRMDEHVISIRGQDSFYTGGVHGNYVLYGYTFDTKTGEKLSISDLFEDKNQALSEIKSYILSLCENPYYKVRLFGSDTLEKDLDGILEDDFWYFCDDGLHFISNAYVLGPYATGDFDFIIPYEELTQLKKAYAYTGNELYPFLINQTAEKDLDGDGIKESFILSVDSEDIENIFMGNWEEPIEPELSATIGGKDYSDVIKESMPDLTTNFNPFYYVVDLDTSDLAKEIMFTDLQANDYCMTYFYRYKNDTLTFLGTIPDRVEYDSFQIHGDGTITARLPLELLETASCSATYRLEGDQLILERQDWYDVDESHMDESYRTHAILQDVTVYTEPDLSSKTRILTPSDGKVSFPSTDNEHWFMLKTQDGDIYYLYLKDFLTIPNGGEEKNADDIFENLLLAG